MPDKPTFLAMGFSPAAAVATWRIAGSGQFECYTYWPANQVNFSSQMFGDGSFDARNVDFSKPGSLPRSGFSAVLLVVPTIKDVARMCQHLRSYLTKSTVVLVDVSGGIAPLQRHVQASLSKPCILGTILDLDAELISGKDSSSRNAPWSVLHRDQPNKSKFFVHIQPPSNLRLIQALEQAWTAQGLTATHPKNSTAFDVLQWERTITTVAFELLSIVLDIPDISKLSTSVVAKPLMEGLISELTLIGAAAGAKGVRSASQFMKNSASLVRSAPADYSRAKGASRLYYDFDRGASVPIDFLLLLPILLSDQLSKGPPTPYLESMFAFMTQLMDLNAQRAQGTQRTLLFSRAGANAENTADVAELEKRLQNQLAERTTELENRYQNQLAARTGEIQLTAQRSAEDQLNRRVEEEVKNRLRTEVPRVLDETNQSQLVAMQALRRQLEQVQSTSAEYQRRNSQLEGALRDLQAQSSQAQSQAQAQVHSNGHANPSTPASMAKEHALSLREQALAAREAEYSRRVASSHPQQQNHMPHAHANGPHAPVNNYPQSPAPSLSRSHTLSNTSLSAMQPPGVRSPVLNLEQNGVFVAPPSSAAARRLGGVANRRGSAQATMALFNAPGSVPGLDAGPMAMASTTSGRRSSLVSRTAPTTPNVGDIDMMSLTANRQRAHAGGVSQSKSMSPVVARSNSQEFSQSFKLDSIMGAANDRFGAVSRTAYQAGEPNLSSDSSVHQRQYVHGPQGGHGMLSRGFTPADLSAGLSSRRPSFGSASILGQANGSSAVPPAKDVPSVGVPDLGNEFHINDEIDPSGRLSNGSSNGSNRSAQSRWTPSRSRSGTPPTPHGLDSTLSTGEKPVSNAFIDIP